MKRSRRPDTRLSWRDPNMPVWREYIMGDGTKRDMIDPEYERRYREYLMTINPMPDYKDDPTYDLKKQRRKL